MQTKHVTPSTIIAAALLLGVWLLIRNWTPPSPEGPLPPQASAIPHEQGAPITLADDSPPTSRLREPTATTDPLREATGASHFRVIDEVTGEPLPDSFASKNANGSSPGDIQSDARGYLVFSSPVRRPGAANESTPGNVLWYVSAPGCAPTAILESQGGRSLQQAVDVALVRCASLTAMVIDSSAAPVAGVIIELEADIRSSIRLPVNEQDFVEAVNGGPSGRRFRRNPFGKLSRADTYVWYERTDAAGVCEFQCLPPNIDITARAFHGVLSIGDDVSLVLQPAQHSTHEWKLPTAHVAHVEVVDQNGQPAARNEIWIVQPSNRELRCVGDQPYALFSQAVVPFKSAYTDSNGQATILDLPNGSWYIGLAPRVGSQDDEMDPQAIAPIGKLIRVDSDRTDIHLDVVRGVYVAGIAIDHLGDVLADVTIRLAVAGQLCGFYGRTTNVRGEFLIGPVGSAPLHLMASLPDGTPAVDFDVTAGDLAVVVEIPELLSVSGLVLDEHSREPVPIRFVSLFGETGTRLMERLTSDGTFSIDGVRPGTYSLVVHSADNAKIAFLPSLHISSSASADKITMFVHQAATVTLKNETSGFGVVRALNGIGVVATLNVAPGETVTASLPCGPTTFEMHVHGVPLVGKSVDLKSGVPATIEWQ